VDKLIAELAEQDFNTWRDLDDIGGGAAWRAAISRAIRTCESFLVVLSPQSVASKNVVKELSLADEHRRPIIPVRFQEFEVSPDIEYQLSGLQWVDFSVAQYSKALDDLLKALRVERQAYQSGKLRPIRNMPTPPPPPPKPAPEPVRTQEAFKFCIQCGAKLIPQNLFCIGCGRRL
jgi:hypothetical protein